MSTTGDVISLADARAARRPVDAYENDPDVKGTPAGIIDNALIDVEWSIEEVQKALTAGDWPTVTRHLNAATNLLKAAMEAVP
ncbi:MAG TPA: hypothetical protein VK730_13545 [Solirubrobacteraceae bacterium]|nr:hypothetical protein [Solirubrobacteraceae bacterium]